MKSDARLIENIQYTSERCAYLCCKAYSLALAAGQGRRTAGKAQILQTYIFKKAETGFDLFYYPVGDDMLFFVQLQSVNKIHSLDNGHIAHTCDIYPSDCNRKRFLSQTLTMALGACDL